MNTNGVPPPPGCKVRGCCMGIPIGCGALAVLALPLLLVFQVGCVPAQTNRIAAAPPPAPPRLSTPTPAPAPAPIPPPPSGGITLSKDMTSAQIQQQLGRLQRGELPAGSAPAAPPSSSSAATQTPGAAPFANGLSLGGYPMHPQFIEPVQIGAPNVWGESPEAPLPSVMRTPVTVHLRECKDVDGKCRWIFRVINTTGATLHKKIRVFLRINGGDPFVSHDLDQPLGTENSTESVWNGVFYFDTGSKPPSFGGNVTHYGWAVAP